MEILKDILSHVAKWMFTWAIALLPIMFQCYQQYILCGRIILSNLSETGEFFIVSIVMVAEPLAMLVMSRNRNVFSLFFLFFIIVMLVTSGYCCCLNESTESPNVFFGELYEKDVQARLTSISLTCMNWSVALGLATIINIRLGARNKS
jgi:hypothetical protein